MPNNSQQTIHQSFATEFAIRRLARKRVARGRVNEDDDSKFQSNSCSDDDQPPSDIVEGSGSLVKSNETSQSTMFWPSIQTGPL